MEAGEWRLRGGAFLPLIPFAFSFITTVCLAFIPIAAAPAGLVYAAAGLAASAASWTVFAYLLAVKSGLTPMRWLIFCLALESVMMAAQIATAEGAVIVVPWMVARVLLPAIGAVAAATAARARGASAG